MKARTESVIVEKSSECLMVIAPILHPEVNPFHAHPAIDLVWNEAKMTRFPITGWLGVVGGFAIALILKLVGLKSTELSLPLKGSRD